MTIVVILILAGVSINLILGSNGLISKVKDVKTKTEQDAVNTEIAMNNLYDKMVGILDEIEEDDNSDDVFDLDQLKIGDYVDYTYDTVLEGYTLLAEQSGYTGSNDDGSQTIDQNSTVLKWRVLNINKENNTMDLVSAEPTSNIVYLRDAIGYNNGVYLLNDICKELYSNTSLEVTARNINLTDMEKHLTADGFTARIDYTATLKYGTSKLYGVKYSFYPEIYSTQSGAGIDVETVTQPDIDGIVDPYNESSDYYLTPTLETYSQADAIGLTATQTYYYIPIDDTNYR